MPVPEGNVRAPSPDFETIAEEERLEAVRRYDILDTPPDGTFDRVTAIAARVFDVPISIVSLVDQDRIWFKSHHGLNVRQIDRRPGLCASAILQDDVWLLTDATKDIRSLANPLVAGEFGLRFYAGVPLKTYDGYNLGTLCVIDREPRDPRDEQIAMLQDLAATVMDQMEVRLSARRSLAQAQEQEEHLRLVINELNHRVKNTLAIIQSVARQSLREPLSLSEAKEKFEERLAALAEAHDILTRQNWQSASLREIFERAVRPVRLGQGRIRLKGPEMMVPPQTAVSLAMAAHELTTNACKYGSLSTPEGHVDVRWHVDRGRLQLSWQESGGPRVAAPAKQGFGTLMLQRALAAELNGEVTLRFEQSGLVCTVHAALPSLSRPLA